MSLHPLPGAVAAVSWCVVLETAPGAVRPCPRCNQPRLHVPAGAFRINGNGRRLDVWLLYHCSVCSRTWKLPLHERVRPQSLGARLLLYEANDPDLAGLIACDGARLRAHGAVPQEPAWRVVGPELAGLDRVSITVEGPWRPRLDRLLVRALGLSRSRVERAWAAGDVAIAEASKKALRRPLAPGVAVALRLAELRRHPVAEPANVRWRAPA